MADSTEELTPVLIPFEKNIRSNSGDTYDYNPFRNDSAWTSNTNNTTGSSSDGLITVTDEQKKNAEKYGPDALLGPGSEYHKKKYGLDTQSTPAVKPKKEKKPHKDWRDSDADHGLSVMSNLAGSITSGLATAGDATRKMVQGILNPGVMGQGAAGGMLEAADTVITPTKQSKEIRANLENASIFSMEHEEMKNAVKAYQEKEAMRAKMNEQAAELFKTTPWHQMYTQRLTPEQYEQFAGTWNNNLDALVALWKRDGAPPDLIDDVYKAYSSPLDIAKKNYEQGIRTSRAAETYDRAENEAENAAGKAAAVNTAMARTRKNFDDVSKLDNMGWVNVYKNWALQNGLARLDQGEIVLNDRDLFTDQFGNTIDSPDFDSATAKVNYAAKGSTLNNFIEFLANSSIDNNQKWAADLSAGMTKYNEIEGARKKAASDAAFYEMQAKEQAPIRYSDNTGHTKVNDAAADAIKGFGTRFIQLYGKELGLTAQQLDSLAKNGGLASKSIDDYEALSKLHGVLSQRHGRVQDELKQISNTIATKANLGEALPELSEDQLALFREELVYQNLSYRLLNMEKKRDLDRSILSFSRRLDQNGHEYVDEEGYPEHASQLDVLRRLRTEADIRLDKALDALNDDLVECTIATLSPSSKLAGGQVYDAAKSKWGYITFDSDPTADLAKNQAHHLYLMIRTDHDGNGVLGDLSDNDMSFKPPTIDPDNDMIPDPDRRVHYRFSDYMKWINEAAHILGGTELSPDNDMFASTKSEEGKIGKAAATQVMRAIGGLFDVEDGSAESIVRGLKTPRGNNNLFIDPNLVFRYRYGEFGTMRPPSARDMSGIGYLIQSIDNLWDAKSQNGPNSLPVYTDDEKNAMKQYRAAITVNSTDACLKRDLANGLKDPTVKAVINAYKSYTHRTRINDETAMKELNAILRSGEFGELKTNLRLTKIRGDDDTYIRKLMGKDRENYVGTIPQKEVKKENLTDPKNTFGLMNYIYANVYSPMYPPRSV